MVRRIVYKNFRRYCNCQDDIDILISEGTLYLIDLLNRKDENGHFEAFIGSSIKGRLKNYVNKWNRERATVKVDKLIHKHPSNYETEVSHKLWLLDELERYIPHPQAKKILGLLRQGYSAKDIQTMLGIKYAYSYTYELVNVSLRKIAVRIMKQRSMGIIDSQWMFGCKDFDSIKA
jgi:DNA-directed RNA polymerase specialized sigma24 family protein